MLFVAIDGHCLDNEFIRTCKNHDEFFFLKIFKNLFDRERSQVGREAGRERERRKQAPRGAESPMRDLIPGPWDHDLSQRQWLNPLSHPEWKPICLCRPLSLQIIWLSPLLFGKFLQVSSKVGQGVWLGHLQPQLQMNYFNFPRIQAKGWGQCRTHWATQAPLLLIFFKWDHSVHNFSTICLFPIHNESVYWYMWL